MSDEGFAYILCPKTEERPRSGEGSVIELKDGRLLLAYGDFHGPHDHSPADIVARISEDGGRSWSEPYILQENDAEQNVMSVSFLRLSSGEIALFYARKNSGADCHLYMRLSNDEAQTFGPAVCVNPREGYHVVNNDRPIQLSTGRILVPTAWVRDIKGGFEDMVSFCDYSDDGGKTWHPSPSTVGMDGTVQEPGVVELRNGDVLMIVRTTKGFIYETRSHDGGLTWEPLRPTVLTAPCAPATIKRIPQTGDLLIIYNNNGELSGPRAGRRTPLTSAISRDEGETWENMKDIEPDLSRTYCYVSACFTGDDVLLTYYEGVQSNLESLKIRRMPVRWFYD